jgi:hypothetical protein
MNTRPGAPPPPPRPGGGADPSQRMLTEIAQLRVKATGRDLLLLRVGVAGMIAGPVLAVVGYAMSSQAATAFIQRDAIVVALIGLTVAMVGGALFLRYSLAEFLRFWMARLVAEQARPAVPAPVAPVPAPRREPAQPVQPVPAPNPSMHTYLPNGRMAPGPQVPSPAPPPPPPPSSSPYGPMTDRRPEQ